MGKHWSEKLSCHLCGKVFRSTGAEMRHRHNAKFVCKAYPKEKPKPQIDKVWLDEIDTLKRTQQEASNDAQYWWRNEDDQTRAN